MLRRTSAVAVNSDVEAPKEVRGSVFPFLSPVRKKELTDHDGMRLWLWPYPQRNQNVPKQERDLALEWALARREREENRSFQDE